SPWSPAMSSQSEANQPSLTRPAPASMRSDEPTFTTMRRKSARLGAFDGMAMLRRRTLRRRAVVLSRFSELSQRIGAGAFGVECREAGSGFRGAGHERQEI